MILYTSFCRIAAQACFACLLAAGAAAADREAFIVSGGFATPPYQFLDKNGSHSGYDVDLMKAAARVAGLEVQFEQEGPTASFTPDVLLAEAYPADNAEGVLQFCTPHSTHTHTVFVRDDDLYRNLKDLRGRDVLATRRSPVYDWLKSHGFGENLVATQDVKSAIALLAAGNYEAVVCERHAGLQAIADGNLDNLRALDDSIFPVQYSFAVMREDKELFDALESALTVLKNTGEDKKIRDKWLATPSKKRLALGAFRL